VFSKGGLDPLDQAPVSSAGFTGYNSKDHSNRTSIHASSTPRRRRFHTLNMLSQSITIPPTSSYPLHITAKRYPFPGFDVDANLRASTLLVLHSTSFHKETWEPSLSHLFDLATREGGQGLLIREAWAVECPNHGESVKLNEEALKEGEYTDSCTCSHYRSSFWADRSAQVSCEHYAIAIHQFLTSGVVDFSNRNLIGIGHSLGANAM
jgi:hypothetical protein